MPDRLRPGQVDPTVRRLESQFTVDSVDRDPPVGARQVEVGVTGDHDPIAHGPALLVLRLRALG